MKTKTIIEPFQIRGRRAAPMTTREERERILRDADFNVFNIPARDVLIDLLTDSGTGAMSSLQWSAIMGATRSYAGAAASSVPGPRAGHHGVRSHPPHASGKGGRAYPVRLVGGPGRRRPNNTHFDTTRANIEYSGPRPSTWGSRKAADPTNRHPFKGNMDVAALERLIERVGVEAIPLVHGHGHQQLGRRSAGEPREPPGGDAPCATGTAFRCSSTRAALPKTPTSSSSGNPDRASGRSRDIVRDMFDLGDGATISAKKDGLVNIGGFLCTNDDSLARQEADLLILTEGYPTYGGLAGRDLAATAVGLREALEEDYLSYRISSTAYLGRHLSEAGIPIVQPPGGHAVYLDARRFAPHVPPARFPGVALACELYAEGGIRAAEIGTLMFGEHAQMDLVRLAIPRRVYTQSHIDYVIEILVEIHDNRSALRGFELVYEAPFLRHFTARLAPLGDDATTEPGRDAVSPPFPRRRRRGPPRS